MKLVQGYTWTVVKATEVTCHLASWKWHPELQTSEMQNSEIEGVYVGQFNSIVMRSNPIL